MRELEGHLLVKEIATRSTSTNAELRLGDPPIVDPTFLGHHAAYP
jgi:hypothetical protein